jgi:hypothetical protein
MSEIKVNKISPRANCGTVQLGDSGDTFTIPSGATINNQGTATNFGATGSASWTTTVKTGDFTAVAGEGYFVDTSSGEIDVTLPAGTAGAVIAISDYAQNFATNNCILVQNGSDKIGGSTNNAKLNTDGIAVTLIFIDSTKGWIITDDGNQSSADTNPFLQATGGTITTTGNCKIHTFTGPGSFDVSKIAETPANNEISYMVVAGGGGGGWEVGGGGGGGGFREDKSPITPYTASPLDGAGAITIGSGPSSFPVTVGAGGTGGDPAGSYPSPAQAPNGSNSIFSSITSAGGGGGGSYNSTPGANGGSGGGGAGLSSPTPGGSGNTPPVSPAQGTSGGTGGVGGVSAGGGGGGATASGSPASPVSSPTGLTPQAAGATTNISGSPVQYSQGGKGSADGAEGAVGAANTGTGGDGGGSNPVLGRAGGSGIVIIRYKFQ